MRDALTLAFTMMGGGMAAVLNAANEVAVDAFIKGKIGFNDISRTVRFVTDCFGCVSSEISLEDVLEADRLLDVLSVLREALENLPLLVTFRTKQEGGEQEISAEAYKEFLKCVLASGKADLIDVELFMGDELLESIAKAAHPCGVKVVASSHDFAKTPEKEEIIRRLCRMQELGADLLKIAVMPKSTGDVLTLLQATWEMHSVHAKQPVITMSMGGTGAISRLSGEVFGSALTFGSAGKASAPGQVAVQELKNVLKVVHESR